MSRHHPMMPLDEEQQMLLNLIQNSSGNLRAYDMMLPQYKRAAEKLNYERHQKNSTLMSDIENIRVKTDNTNGDVAAVKARIANLESHLNALGELVKTDNGNYSRMLAHTKSVLATVQETNRDLVTDTQFLRHEMEKIHSTIRVVPNLQSDIKKFEIRIDVAENDIMELKNPPANNYHWYVVGFSVFIAFLSWVYKMTQKKEQLAIDF